MCDPIPLRNWLIVIAAVITAAVVTIVGAAIANGSYWYVFLSPFGMLVAAGLTGLAAFFCSNAIGIVDSLNTCTHSDCAMQCNNMRNTLEGSRVVLGIQATACLTVAAYAWIPNAAEPAMWVIIGTLIVQFGLIISAIAFFNNLAMCVRKES